jgi:hypothetical protein
MGAATGFSYTLGKEIASSGPINWSNVASSTATGLAFGVLAGSTAALSIMGGTGAYSAAQIAAASGLIGGVALTGKVASKGPGAAIAGFICQQLGGGSECKAVEDIGKVLERKICE